MLRGIWEVFVARFTRETEDGDGEARSRFVPSPLDLSVRVAHGGRDDEIEREFSKIDEQVREIEESRRRD